MRKFWYSFLLLSVSVVQLNAANGGMSYPKKVVDGKTYYEYPVQKSEGFYSICKKFGVTEDEIKAVNPGTEKGLVYDSVILVPYKEQNYTLHKVNRKETLYSISKKYDVSMDDLYEANPKLKTDGLKSGTEIRIPEKKKLVAQTLTVSDTMPKVAKVDQPSFTIHEVEKGETLYSISRRYGISSDEIIRLNPDVKDGVKIGKKIIIPPVHSNTAIRDNSVEGKNTKFITHQVKKQETLYSLSKQYGVTIDEIVKLNPSVNDGLKEGGWVIIPPSFNNTSSQNDSLQARSEPTLVDSITDVKDLFPRSLTPKKNISIAIALPFQLSKVTDKNKIDGTTKKFLEFYQGFLLAIDSLKQNGISFKIYTYDSGKSEADIQKVLEKPEVKEVDLFIGPAYSTQFKKVSDFILENNIKMIVPFSSRSEETIVNPNIFQISAPVDKSNFLMADLFINSFKDKNIVLWRFKNTTYDDKKLFADTLESMLKERNIPYKMVYFDNLATIRAAMVNDKDNIVVPLTTNQVALSQALPIVNMLPAEKRNVELFGFTEWQNYQSISKDLYVLTTYFASPYHVDFNNPAVKNYLLRFRRFYNAEPFNSQPQYGMVGYDLAMYFSTQVSKNGRDFEFSETRAKSNLLQSNFRFVRCSEKGGFYSTGFYLVKHNDRTGMTAIDNETMTVCSFCSENAKQIENSKKSNVRK